MGNQQDPAADLDLHPSTMSRKDQEAIFFQRCILNHFGVKKFKVRILNIIIQYIYDKKTLTLILSA